MPSLGWGCEMRGHAATIDFCRRALLDPMSIDMKAVSADWSTHRKRLQKQQWAKLTLNVSDNPMLWKEIVPSCVLYRACRDFGVLLKPIHPSAHDVMQDEYPLYEARAAIVEHLVSKAGIYAVTKAFVAFAQLLNDGKPIPPKSEQPEPVKPPLAKKQPESESRKSRKGIFSEISREKAIREFFSEVGERFQGVVPSDILLSTWPAHREEIIEQAWATWMIEDPDVEKHARITPGTVLRAALDALKMTPFSFDKNVNRILSGICFQPNQRERYTNELVERFPSYDVARNFFFQQAIRLSEGVECSAEGYLQSIEEPEVVEAEVEPEVVGKDVSKEEKSVHLDTGIQLKVGEQYLTRQGGLVTIIPYEPPAHLAAAGFLFRGRERSFYPRETAYLANGKFSRDIADHPRDLVKLVEPMIEAEPMQSTVEEFLGPQENDSPAYEAVVESIAQEDPHSDSNTSIPVAAVETQPSKSKKVKAVKVAPLVTRYDIVVRARALAKNLGVGYDREVWHRIYDRCFEDFGVDPSYEGSKQKPKMTGVMYMETVGRLGELLDSMKNVEKEITAEQEGKQVESSSAAQG